MSNNTDIDKSIFKSYDIRAIYPTQINEQNLPIIINSIYELFKKKLNKENVSVVLGKDMRVSSPQLFDVAKETLLNLGATVIDVGLVSTPTFYFAVNHFRYDAGIQITASHNPKEYNGVKMVINSNKGLIKIGKSTGMDEIKSGVEDLGFTPSDSRGDYKKLDGVVSKEVENALSMFGHPKINSFKISADAANAMGAIYIEELFKKLSCNLIKINFDLDGTFPNHPPDPLDHKNLEQTIQSVKENNCDLGISPDGDGDRLFFVDELGQVVPPSIITAIIAEEFLKHNPGSTFLFDIRYILTAQKIITELGGKYEITKVGHAFITESMGKFDAIFAGESSAHYFYKDTGNAESQVATIVCVLKVLSESNLKFSELVKKYQKSFESGEINFEINDKEGAINKIKEKYSDGNLNDLDGIAIMYDDWRFSLRSSNTEPLLRLNVESYDKDKLELKTSELIELLKSYE